MKKTISIIAIALCLVLFMPSVPCFAYDVQDVYARTYNSVQGYWDDPDYQTWQNNLTSLSSSNSDYETIVDIVANYRSMSGYPASYDDFEHVAIFLNLDETVVNFYFCDWSDFLWVENYGSIESSPVHNFVTCFLGRPSNSDGAFGSVALSQPTVFTAGSWNINSLGSSEGAIWHVDTKGTILYCNFDLFCFNDYTEKGFTNPNSYQNIYTHYEDLENFMNPDLPYVNGDGVIVNPNAPEVENNSNHMYLKSCDVGFCKPYSDFDLSSAGGGYLYVKYTFDNWINSHSSDYWVNIRTVVNVDGTQYSGINTRALDLNGVNVLTFSESTVPNDWTNEGLLFVEFPNTVVSTYKSGYVYSIPYPTFASTDSSGVSNRSRFLGNGRNRLFLTPSGGRGFDITDQPLGDALEELFNIVSHEKFTITVTVWLQDTNDNRSGEFTKSFNLITGVGTTMDTSITDNDNPFEPDPMYPDIPDGSGNDSYSVAPIVNNFTINGSGSIGFDPGYRDLKSDLDADPDDNFTQYLAPFKNNEVGGFVGDFLDDMPTALKSIFIGGFGVLTLLGIYRFIRRG